LWHERRWRFLLNLIDHLPSHSFYNEARANDQELAEALAKYPEPEHHERLSNWTTEVVMLAAIVDRLADLINATVMVQGAKKISIPRVERPRTALQEIREKQDREKHDALVRKMVPKS
jgi:hypothetical protein